MKNTAYGLPKSECQNLLLIFLPQLARRGGQSIEEMCTELGITREYFGQLESGAVPLESISPDLVQSIASFSGMQLEMVRKLARLDEQGIQAG